ncbi:MAG: hypothetical protein KAT69_10120 [Candidatus Aminicenantes bacterium]|nr:hypothetical protein [Candidatus Aminicenantes bacterium]
MTNLEKFNALEDSHAKELSMKHARIMEEIEQLPPGTEISSAKKKELVALKKELQKILEENLIGDVIPVRLTIREILSTPKSIEEKVIAPLIPFNFEVFSGINTRIGRFRIEATSKEEAWKKARKKALMYQGQVSLKIS